jgi:hypothetical protein
MSLKPRRIFSTIEFLDITFPTVVIFEVHVFATSVPDFEHLSLIPPNLKLHIDFTQLLFCCVTDHKDSSNSSYSKH